MRELTKKEKEFILYEIGGYELEFEDNGLTYNKTILVNMIYSDLFDGNFFGNDMKEIKFAGEQAIKDYIYSELSNSPEGMFK